MSELLAAGQELRSTNRPIYGASIININETMYIYGGFYNVAPWNKEALWILSNAVNKLSQLNTDPFKSPAVIYHTLQSIDNQTLFSFGGHLNPDDILLPPVNGTITEESLRYYKLDLHTNNWTPLQKKNSSGVPLERFWHSTVQFDSTIYLFGGLNVTSGVTDSFWKYNHILDTWSKLNSTGTRCGHTSTITNDGKMIVLGGFDCSKYSFIAPQDKALYPLSNAAIFNTLTTQWYDQHLGGEQIPNPRTFHTAVKTIGDDKIIITGGQDGKSEPFQTYMSDTQMTAILDIRTWQWSFPPENTKASLYQPFPRSFAVSSLVNKTKIVYGLGLNYHTVYDGFYIFDIETLEWESPVNETLLGKGLVKIADHMLISTKGVIGLSVSTAMVCLVLLGYWIMKRHRNTVSIFLSGLKKSIWNRRQGEPVWAEITRFMFRFSFLAIFIIISAVLVIQIQNSPIIDQIHHDKNILTSSPDIRFCLDGWIDQPPPKIQCTTDYGQSCTEHIIDITKKVDSNLNYYGSKLTCYLFFGSNVYLGNNRLVSNGSQLHFHYYYDSMDTIHYNRSIIHVELYHPMHNPNIPVYNIQNNSTFDRWYSNDEMAKFQADEQANLKTENVYNIHPLATSQIGYEFSKREKIDLTAWNYVGFGTQRETMHQMKSSLHHDAVKKNDINNELFLKGSLVVYPYSDSTIVIREQRAFTVIHGMGIIGGIFGLIIGIQANLFGYRPRSPWGIVHRWSIGLMRRSLLKGLRSRFSNNVHIPIIHPVHRRYSEKTPTNDSHITAVEDDDDNDRMMKLEERLHVFEMLFQAYYIDDEVFRSLSQSNTGV